MPGRSQGDLPYGLDDRGGGQQGRRCEANAWYEFRVFEIAVQLAEEIWVVHAFQKKSTQGIKTPKREIELIKEPFEETEGDVAMKKEKLDVVRGSGNVFRDLGHKNADAEQFKAILAAEIIKALDREHLTVRAAHSRTGIAAADFSRIRNADLGRFTLDRLMSIINRLGSRVEVKVRIRRAEAGHEARA